MGDEIKLELRFANKYSVQDDFFRYYFHMITLPLMLFVPNKLFFQLYHLAAYYEDWILTYYEVTDSGKSLDLVLMDATSKYPFYRFKAKKTENKITNIIHKPKFGENLKKQAKIIFCNSIVPGCLNAGIMFALSNIFNPPVSYILIFIGCVGIVSLLTALRVMIGSIISIRKFKSIMEHEGVNIIDEKFSDSSIVPLRFKKNDTCKSGFRTIRIAGDVDDIKANSIPGTKLWIEAYVDGKRISRDRYVPLAYNYLYIDEDIKEVELKYVVNEKRNLSAIFTYLSCFFSLFAPQTLFEKSCMAYTMMPNEISLILNLTDENDIMI